jgi:hypothetical protein
MGLSGYSIKIQTESDEMGTVEKLHLPNSGQILPERAGIGKDKPHQNKTNA